jgi:uncharacterized protein YndB with AHSA1/START domain
MSTFTTDRATNTIHFRRSLAVPASDAFDAWTEPDQVAAWWDPTGQRLVRCEIDLRVGGTFTFVNAGHSPPFTGTYRAIERPGRLVFEVMGALGTVQFEQAGDQTNMHVQIRCTSAEHLAHFVQLGVAEGTDRTLDNLAVHLSGGGAMKGT